MNRRQLTTVLHLLRYHAQYQRRMHGETLSERPGGIELTPSEMETWADELEAAGSVSPHDPPDGCLDCLRAERALPGRSVGMAMLPNGHHPGPRCACASCLAQYPETLPGRSETDWLDT